MAGMQIMGQTPQKAVTYVLMIGGSATLAKFATDSLTSKLFVQTAAEETSSPRSTDQRKMVQLYRGLIAIGGGLLVGKMLWRYSRPLAFGLTTGAVISGIDRIATTYDIKRQVKNLFLSSADQIAAPASTEVPAYGVMMMLPAAGGYAARASFTGPVVMCQRVAMGG